MIVVSLGVIRDFTISFHSTESSIGSILNSAMIINECKDDVEGTE